GARDRSRAPWPRQATTRRPGPWPTAPGRCQRGCSWREHRRRGELGRGGLRRRGGLAAGPQLAHGFVVRLPALAAPAPVGRVVAVRAVAVAPDGAVGSGRLGPLGGREAAVDALGFVAVGVEAGLTHRTV